MNRPCPVLDWAGLETARRGSAPAQQRQHAHRGSRPRGGLVRQGTWEEIDVSVQGDVSSREKGSSCRVSSHPCALWWGPLPLGENARRQTKAPTKKKKGWSRAGWKPRRRTPFRLFGPAARDGRGASVGRWISVSDRWQLGGRVGERGASFTIQQLTSFSPFQLTLLAAC